MNPFVRFWRWLFPRPLVSTRVSDCYAMRQPILDSLVVLANRIAIRNSQIAEARKKKTKRSHLIEANQRDRTEMLRLEKQLGEWVV